MLWLVYLIDQYHAYTLQGVFWMALYIVFGCTVLIIPLIALVMLVGRWKTLTARQRMHLIIAVLVY